MYIIMLNIHTGMDAGFHTEDSTENYDLNSVCLLSYSQSRYFIEYVHKYFPRCEGVKLHQEQRKGLPFPMRRPLPC